MKIPLVFILAFIISVCCAQDFNYDGLREVRYMPSLENYAMHLNGKDREMLHQLEVANLITVLRNVKMSGNCMTALDKLFHNITDFSPQTILKLLGEPAGKGYFYF